MASKPTKKSTGPRKKTKSAPKKSSAAKSRAPSASKAIDRRIAELADWRGRTLRKLRATIRSADPAIVEEWKWNTPVWSRDGIVCTGETYKQVVKLTFAKGASIADPSGLFNSSLDGKVRRAIDVRETDRIDEAALRKLVRGAVALNLGKKPAGKAAKAAKPALLAGGNPQIPKADGDAPVQAYLAAVPGWKRDIGLRLDALVVRHVPEVRKAVRWNSPFYGIEGRGWFMAFHVYTCFVKVTFFRGTSLSPAPPGGTTPDARWIDIHEDDFDEARLSEWIRQAAALPGWGKN